MTESTASSRAQSWGAAGASKSTSRSRSRSLARSMRFWTLASVVSRPRAISAVLNPQSVRSAKATRDSAGTAHGSRRRGGGAARRRSRRRRCLGRRRFPLGLIRQVRQHPGVGLLPPPGVDREIAGGAVEPAGRVFGNAAPRPRFQGLHERGLHDVLDQVEPAHAERPGQHGDEPAELVAKKVLPGPRGSFMRSRPIRGSRSRCRPGHSRAMATAAS